MKDEHRASISATEPAWSLAVEAIEAAGRGPAYAESTAHRLRTTRDGHRLMAAFLRARERLQGRRERVGSRLARSDP